MCGICGVVDFRFGGRRHLGAVRTMVSAMAHRGPDGRGFYCSGPLAMGSARLAITGSVSAKQPFFNESGDVAVVFNGEIYNFESLRVALRRLGHSFASNCDGEVVAHLYEEKGESLLAELEGMFALAIWDSRRSRLILARDPFGEKPLLYCRRPAILAWASELAPLLSVAQVGRAIDVEALGSYLALGYVPGPASAFQAVKKLGPGQAAVFDKDGLRLSRYFRLAPTARASPLHYSQATKALRRELEQAVVAALPKGKPCAVLLSGGADSSALLGLVSRHAGKGVAAFSADFSEPGYSELAFSRLAANRWGVEHVVVTVERPSVCDLASLVGRFGEPFADSAAWPRSLLYRALGQSFKVALSGDGCDELFGGYGRHVGIPPRLVKAVEAWQGLAAGCAAKEAIARKLAACLARTHLSRSSVFSGNELSRAKQAALGEPAQRHLASLFAMFLGCEPEALPMLVDASGYLTWCIAACSDIASMAVSVEARSPFLRAKLAALACSFPAAWRIRDDASRKLILRSAVADLLPKAVRDRRKMGLLVPVGAWLRGELGRDWEAAVFAKNAISGQLFSSDYLRRLQASHQKGSDHADKMWALLMLELWWQRWR